MPGHYRRAKKHTEKGGMHENKQKGGMHEKKKEKGGMHEKKEKSYSDHCGSGTMKLNRMNRGDMKKHSVYMKKYTN